MQRWFQQSIQCGYQDLSWYRDVMYPFIVAYSLSTLWTQCKKLHELPTNRSEKMSLEFVLYYSKGIVCWWDDRNTDGNWRRLWSWLISWNSKHCDSGAPLLALHTHLAKSSRVLISGLGFFIICLIGASVRGISLSHSCFAAYAFSTQDWNTSFWAFIHRVWMVTSCQFDCQYACLSYIIALSGSSEHLYIRLSRSQIWSEYLVRSCIFTKLKSDSLMRWCATSYFRCFLSSSTQWCFAAGQRLFQVGSLCHCLCLCRVSCCFKAFEIFMVDVLLRNRLKAFLW